MLTALLAALVYALDQAIGFTRPSPDYDYNWSRFAKEKWLKGNDGKWYYLLPDGSLWRWDSGRQSLLGDKKIDDLTAAVYANPELLWNAQPATAPEPEPAPVAPTPTAPVTTSADGLPDVPATATPAEEKALSYSALVAMKHVLNVDSYASFGGGNMIGNLRGRGFAALADAIRVPFVDGTGAAIIRRLQLLHSSWFAGDGVPGNYPDFSNNYRFGYSQGRIKPYEQFRANFLEADGALNVTQGNIVKGAILGDLGAGAKLPIYSPRFFFSLEGEYTAGTTFKNGVATPSLAYVGLDVNVGPCSSAANAVIRNLQLILKTNGVADPVQNPAVGITDRPAFIETLITDVRAFRDRITPFAEAIRVASPGWDQPEPAELAYWLNESTVKSTFHLVIRGPGLEGPVTPA